HQAAIGLAFLSGGARASLGLQKRRWQEAGQNERDTVQHRGVKVSVQAPGALGACRGVTVFWPGNGAVRGASARSSERKSPPVFRRAFDDEVLCLVLVAAVSATIAT